MSAHITDTSLLPAQGYKQITNEYVLPEEEEAFERAKAQLDKNSISYVIVENDAGLSIWRKNLYTLVESRAGEGGEL